MLLSSLLPFEVAHSKSQIFCFVSLAQRTSALKFKVRSLKLDVATKILKLCFGIIFIVLLGVVWCSGCCPFQLKNFFIQKVCFSAKNAANGRSTICTISFSFFVSCHNNFAHHIMNPILKLWLDRTDPLRLQEIESFYEQEQVISCHLF